MEKLVRYRNTGSIRLQKAQQAVDYIIGPAQLYDRPTSPPPHPTQALLHMGRSAPRDIVRQRGMERIITIR